MPGLAAVVSRRTNSRRPAMMTVLPSWWNASASPRPMPEPPPVIRIVLPVVFIGDLLGEQLRVLRMTEL